MRAFIAIPLPPEVKRYLKKMQESLAAARADVKWVEHENIHLTLKFLGEIDQHTVEKVTSYLDEIGGMTAPYVIRLSHCGAFPRIESARVIWMGIDQGELQTRALYNLIEERLHTIGVPCEDRPFSSHITLGRTRSGKNRAALAALLKKHCHDLGGQRPEFSAEKITLFKSTLTPRGPIYESLHEACLTLR